LKKDLIDQIVLKGSESKNNGKLDKGVERIDLKNDIMTAYRSFKASIISQGQHCFELCGFVEDDVRYFAGYDADHMI